MKLLLAEDEKELNQALTAMLLRSGYEVESVGNGLDALACLESGSYDGAVLDIMMPFMDGLTVLKTLRMRGNSLPVLFLTAKSEIDDRVEGLDSGADDYLTKPFAMKELLARIRAMTRRAAEEKPGLLSFGDITLDSGSFELRSPSGSVRLSGKEFGMMELLLSNPGQLISTRHFMEKVWGYDSEAEINVVWVYLSYLRKKLASIHSDVQIKASRNLGYFLEVSP